MTNLIVTAYLTYQQDPQRPGITWQKNIKMLEPLIDSVLRANQKLVILNDCFDEKNSSDIQFERVIPNKYYAPTLYRRILFSEFLQKTGSQINNYFFIDSTDVQLLNNPFPFIDQEKIYVGNEFGKRFKCAHLKKSYRIPYIQIPDYFKVIDSVSSNKTLLNAGIIGGESKILTDFHQKLCQIITTYAKNITEVSLDSQFVIYTLVKFFYNKIENGSHINTKFKHYEEKSQSWWKHK